MNRVEVQYHIKYRKAGEWEVCGYGVGLDVINRMAISLFEKDNGVTEITVFKCKGTHWTNCKCAEELTGCKKM